MGFGLWYIVHIKFDTREAVRLTDSGGTLENLIYLSAEGARPWWPNLSGKGTEKQDVFCRAVSFLLN